MHLGQSCGLALEAGQGKRRCSPACEPQAADADFLERPAGAGYCDAAAAVRREDVELAQAGELALVLNEG